MSGRWAGRRAALHPEAWAFLERVVPALQPAGKRILEFGSYDVNGSARPIFSGCAEYVGMDLRPGPGVDVVGDAREYDGAGAFDVCVCTETLEHCPEPERFIEAAWRSLKPGGVLIITAAAPPREPHGMNGELDPSLIPYYRNIEPSELEAMLAGWQDVTVEYHPRGDVYATAVRP